MKPLKRFSFVVALSLLIGQGLTAQVFADTKIAVLDWRTALLGTEQASAEFKMINEALSADEKEVKDLAEQAKKLQDKLKKQASKLSDDEKRQLSKQIQEKAEEFQFLGQRLKKEQRERQETYVRGVRPLLDDAVKTVITDQKIDILLDRQAVTYVKPELDITALVIAELNKLQAPTKKQSKGSQ